MRDRIKPNLVLRAALALAGAAIILLGANVGLGGIATLGWQGSPDFFAVTDATQFGIHDSHVRFIGGVWLAVGLLMLAGSFAFRRLRGILVALTAMILVGGLARLSALDATVLGNAAILPSLGLELLGFPLFGLWIARAERRPASPA